MCVEPHVSVTLCGVLVDGDVSGHGLRAASPHNNGVTRCVPLICPNPQTSKNQIKVDLVDENFTELRGEIAGPPDTPYEGILKRLHYNDLTRCLLQHL